MKKVSFVVGTANLDISKRVRTELLSMIEKSAVPVLYIVPEQFEYETEHAIYKLLNEKKLLTASRLIKVTTFSALSREILEQTGEDRPIADDIVKNIVMRKVIGEYKAQLEALGGICGKPGFTQKILGTINGFKSVGLDSRSLEENLERIKEDGALSNKAFLLRKLSDVCLLYTAYTAGLSDYLDAPDLASLAAERLVKSGIFENAYVFVDCFNDFTAGQLRFLSEMISVTEQAVFGFTTDTKSRNDVFKSANSNIAAISRFAETNGIKAELINTDIPPRIAENTPLGELSVKLFSGKSSDIPAGDSIDLISACDVYEELDFVCSKIIALVEEKGLRYRDIAVLCTDLGTYERYAESVFKKYNIPIFLDYCEPIIYQPLVNAVNATLRALEDYSVENVLSCIKTGFYSKYDPEKEKRVGLSDYDINVFEDYVYEWAIETDHLKKPFTFKRKGADEDFNANAAEEVRKGTAQPLWELSKKIPKDGMDGAELTKLLYDFLMDTVGIKRALTAKTTNSETGIDREATSLYQRLWDTLIGIFEALYNELSGVNIKPDDYAELFRGLCSATTLSSPPQVADSVLVGDIDRTRADGIKAVFIVGATYDLFPTSETLTGVFSDYENELIRVNITRADRDGTPVPFIKSTHEEFSLALYRAYKALTLPTEYLCLSCPETNAQGDKTEFSEIIGKCQALFKDLKIKSASSFGNEFYCRSERAAKSRFAMHIKDNTYENEVLKNALIENNYKEFVERLNTIRSEHQTTAENAENIGKHSITPENARMLFPNKMGATSIEKLSACGFSFFAEQGLGVREKSRRTFNPSKRGDAIHYVLEKAIGNYSGDMTRLCGLNRAELNALVKHYLAEYCEQETNNTFADDARSRFLFENIAISAVDVLISMQAEFYSRGYRPKFFELSLEQSDEKNYITDNDGKISSELPSAELYSEAEEALPKTAEESGKTESYIITAPLAVKIDDELTVLITGRIDRVDMFTINDGGKDKTYVRAVDYKSSVHSFNLCSALNGINIQMLLYLIALLDANKSNPTVTLTAGGLSYIPSKSSGARDSEISPFKLLAVNHHESSLLVEDKNTDKDLKDYTDFILQRIAEEDGKAELLSAEPSALTPEQQKEREKYSAYLAKLGEAFKHNDLNSIDAEKYDELRNDTIDFLREKLNSLFSGSVDALPLCHIEEETDLTGRKSKIRRNPCNFCRFGDICKNAGKITAEIDQEGWQNKYIKQK